MLVLTLTGENTISIGPAVIRLVRVTGSDRVQLGFEAPHTVQIRRDGPKWKPKDADGNRREVRR